MSFKNYSGSGAYQVFNYSRFWTINKNKLIAKPYQENIDKLCSEAAAVAAVVEADLSWSCIGVCIQVYVNVCIMQPMPNGKSDLS